MVNTCNKQIHDPYVFFCVRSINAPLDENVVQTRSPYFPHFAKP